MNCIHSSSSQPRRRTALAVATVIALAVLAGSTASRADDSTSWSIDPAHSRVGFTVRHLMISDVTGQFPKVAGTIRYDGKDLERASVEVEIGVDSISTQVDKRDAHLKTADFFDVVRFPTMTFKSTAVKRGKGNAFTMAGNLTLHGVTRPVTLQGVLAGPIKDPWGMTRMGAHATTVIHRKDFGMAWNQPLPSGGVMIGEDIPVTLDVEFTHR